MKTAEAAKGQWAMIFEHFGLPPLMPEITLKANVRYVVRGESCVLMTGTAGNMDLYLRQR
jgi:hypothetical protein